MEFLEDQRAARELTLDCRDSDPLFVRKKKEMKEKREAEKEEIQKRLKQKSDNDIASMFETGVHFDFFTVSVLSSLFFSVYYHMF